MIKNKLEMQIQSVGERKRETLSVAGFTPTHKFFIFLEAIILNYKNYAVRSLGVEVLRKLVCI